MQPNLEFDSIIGYVMYKRILENKLRELSKSFPVVSVTGPRQSGKTTLCRMTFEEFAYLNLEDEENRAIMQPNKQL